MKIPPQSKVSIKNSSAHVQSLDGLRALAILAVMMVHANMPGFASGWLGVDLFFVLSGFLITSLLLKEHQVCGGIALGPFLSRRALRLAPAYVIYLFVLSYGMWLWPGSQLSEHGGWTPLSYFAALWTYTVNFAPMGGVWNGQNITIHLWSLAVEQQYYMVWPVIVVALAGKPYKLLVAGLLLSSVTIILFLFAHPQTTMLYTRGFTLILGSCAAVVTFFWRDLVNSVAWRFGAIVAGLLATMSAFILAALTVWTENEVRHRLLPLVGTGFAFIIARLWAYPASSWENKILTNSWLAYVGKVSYGMYLYHEIIRVAVWHYGKPLMANWPNTIGYLTRVTVYVGLTVVIAGLSYRYIESGFLRMKVRFRPTQAVLTKS